MQEDAVDLLQVDDFGAVADGLEQSAEAEILGAAQAAFGGAYDEGERVVGESAVREGDFVELTKPRPSKCGRSWSPTSVEARIRMTARVELPSTVRGHDSAARQASRADSAPVASRTRAASSSKR